MRFRLLGPLEVRDCDDKLVPLRAPKQRTVLAVLLMHPNRRVSVDRLTAALWPERPPRSAHGNVRTYVSGLRQMLTPAGRDRLPQLRFESGGYRLDLVPSELDVLLFEDFEQRGHRALSDGNPAEAARLLWEALRLWRGQPAEDVTVGSEEAATLAGLEERRLVAEEAWADAQLAQGHNAQLIVRLRSLVAGQPLREQLWHRLMVALYRSGRPTEALAAFQELRRRVVDELGIEPGPQVRRLQRQILAGEAPDFRPAAFTTSKAVQPRQLPADIADFTGRTSELQRLTSALAARHEGSQAGAILAVTGTAGAGKTALAVHWARQIADQFGDGQFYVNLRGYAPGRPLEPLEVVARFLRALGVTTEQLPGELDEAAAMYRSLLAGKRMLILLDNAATTEQVRPLLPGTPHSLVLVTSRSSLPGLAARDGAVRVGLDPLTAAEAMLLLRNVLGRERVNAEPQAAAEIATQCGFLPLSLRIAADHVMNRTYLTLAELAVQLADNSDRLDVLATRDDAATTVRTAFSWSYLALPADAARMFRLAGLHPGPDISAAAAAALAGTTERRARQLLDLLAGMHLLEKMAPLRYRFHDLLGAYAAERAAADETAASRSSALWRLLTWYLHAADNATRLLAPAQRPVPVDPPPHSALPTTWSYEDALNWYDDEHGSLVAAVWLAAENGHDDIAWKLAAITQYYQSLRKPWSDWLSTRQCGLMCARRSGDAFAEAWLLNDLGAVYFDQRRSTEALECISKALELRRAVGDQPGEVLCLHNLGIIYRERDQLDRAVECARQALALSRETHDRRGEAIALHVLGETYRRGGQPEEALRCLERSLAHFQAISERRGECFALQSIGEAYRDLRRPDEGIHYVKRALAIRGRAGDRPGEAEALRTLGDLLASTGRPVAARQSWRQALAILDDLDDPQAGEIRDRLAHAP